MTGNVDPDPKVDDRSVYARLRTLIEAYDRHAAVNEFHAKSVYPEGLYQAWTAEAERLEGIL